MAKKGTVTYTTKTGTYVSEPGKTPVYTPTNTRPDTSRNQNLAGQTVYDKGFNVSYNEDGFATKASNVKQTGQTRASKSKDAALDSSSRDQNKAGDANYTTNEEYDVLKQYGDMWTEAYKNNDTEGMAKAHALAEHFRSAMGYSGGEDGSRFIKNATGEDLTGRYQKSAGDSGIQSGPYTGGIPQVQPYSYTGGTAEAARAGNVNGSRANSGYQAIDPNGVDGSQYLPFPVSGEGSGSGSGSGGETVGRLDNTAPDLSGLLNQWLDAAKQQQNLQTDYAVNQGILELQRAEEDAQAQFQTQQNQVDADERKALDNQALYAEARGDRGGIGQAQYAQIQAAAMQNRRAINSARTKLATDTARQIADLRAQGEFKKAEALLELTQTYLSQLMEMEQWGAEFNLDVDKFNLQLDQWEADFEMAAGELLGTYQGSPTLENQKYQDSLSQTEREFLANSGLAALATGVRPSAVQQAAMGYTDAQIDAELAAVQQTQTARAKSSGGGSGSGKPRLTAAQTLRAIEEGILSESVLAAYEYWYGQPLELENDLSERPTNDFGVSYNSIWSRARTMFDQGKSEAEIEAFLDKFSETQLTDAGLDYILSSLNLGGYGEV